MNVLFPGIMIYNPSDHTFNLNILQHMGSVVAINNPSYSLLLELLDDQSILCQHMTLNVSANIAIWHNITIQTT